jgi:hypothetical protein
MNDLQLRDIRERNRERLKSVKPGYYDAQANDTRDLLAYVDELLEEIDDLNNELEA